MIQLATNPVSQKSAAPVPASVMDNLAARFRPGGLCLLVLNPDGSLAYHDSTAGLFFQRFFELAASPPVFAKGSTSEAMNRTRSRRAMPRPELGGGLRPPSEPSPQESLRRQSRRSNIDPIA